MDANQNLNNTTSNKQTQKYSEYCDQGRIEFITFHPSYSYEEFIEGITVNVEADGISSKEIQYKLKPGLFKELCKKA